MLVTEAMIVPISLSISQSYEIKQYLLFLRKSGGGFSGVFGAGFGFPPGSCRR
jgi:hypothetical protein